MVHPDEMTAGRSLPRQDSFARDLGSGFGLTVMPLPVLPVIVSVWASFGPPCVSAFHAAAVPYLLPQIGQ